MCKVRTVHFSAHDHRDVIATKLFSSPGDGDFASPYVLRKSEACGYPSTYNSDLLHNNPDVGDRFDICPFHHCCVLFYQRMLCSWYYVNRDVLGLDGVPDMELYCPNALVLGEYQKIDLLVEQRKPEIKLEPGEDEDQEGEEEWKEIPVFPAGELFYSEELLEGSVAVPDADSFGLYRDRMEAVRAGHDLWIHKEILEGSISIATYNLDDMERALGDDDGIKEFVASPYILLLRWRIAQRLVRSVQWAELTAADMFISMMKHTGFTLTALNKMPAEGQSVAAADGSYSVSREQLDLGELDNRAVIDVFDGPLKQAANLAQRLQAVMDIFMRIPKRNNNKRPAQNLRRGPVPAMRRAKAAKN
jgi:hypothetical protein